MSILEIFGCKESYQLPDLIMKALLDHNTDNTILEVDLMSEYYTDSNGQPVENSKAKYTITKVYSVENMTVEQQQLNI